MNEEMKTATVVGVDNTKDDPELIYMEHLIGESPDIVDETPVGDPDLANRILHVIGSIEAEIAEIKVVAQKQIDRAEVFMEIETQKRQKTVDFLTARLHLFAMTSGKRTVNLPNGSLKLIKRQEKFEYIDTDKVIEWIKVNDRSGDLIRVKEEINKAEVKKYVKETGEIPDGLEITDQDDTFKVVV